jgi:hypothetical protein
LMMRKVGGPKAYVSPEPAVIDNAAHQCIFWCQNLHQSKNMFLL